MVGIRLTIANLQKDAKLIRFFQYKYTFNWLTKEFAYFKSYRR
mgnify:CR=1 FL=1